MKRNESSLKEAIAELVEAYRLRSGIDKAEVKRLWAELMGPMVDRQTEKIKLENRILHIKVESAALKQELMMSRSKIAEKINTHLNRTIIDEVKIW